MKKILKIAAASLLVTVSVVGAVGCSFEFEQPNCVTQALCDHVFDEEEVLKEATCTEDGRVMKVCTDCGKTKITTVKATGHDVVEDKAVDATCTTPGLTAGSHCTACGEVFVKQEEVPAGHVDDNEDSRCDICDTWPTKEMMEVAVETGELIAGNWYRMYYTTSSNYSIRISGEGDIAFVAYGREPGYESNYFFKSGPLYTLEGFEAVFGDGYIDIHMVEGAYNLMKDGVVVPEEGSVIIDSTTKITYFEEGTVFRLV